jgi:hypothetical protein
MPEFQKYSPEAMNSRARSASGFSTNRAIGRTAPLPGPRRM